MYSVIVAFCNVFAFFNVGLPCTLYFVLWLSIKVFVFQKKKKKLNKCAKYNLRSRRSGNQTAVLGEFSKIYHFKFKWL